MSNALILIKPDAIERGIEGTILSQITQFGTIVHICDVVMTEELCDQHYKDHLAKPFYPGLKAEMVGGKLIAIELETKLGVIETRKFCESIRKTYVDNTYVGPRNVIHCSDSEEAAERECALWFGDPKSVLNLQVKKDKNARRSGKIIDKDEFVTRVTDKIRGKKDWPDHLLKDLGKVQFDWENYGYNPGDYSMYGDLIGYNEIGGVQFVGVAAGGDWEYPIFICFYLDQDGKRVRAFIPKDGNCWNYDTKEAFGNDEEKDADLLNKHLKLIADDRYDFVSSDEGDVLIDVDKIKAEISKRIVAV